MAEQALLVSHKLIRVASMWHELWHGGLKEASRSYDTDKNPEGTIAFLEPLRDMVEGASQLVPLYVNGCITSGENPWYRHQQQ